MPQTKETPLATGRVKIHLYDKDGNLKLSRDIKNIVVNTGLGFIASRMLGNSPAVMSHMAVGSDATMQTSTQTDLLSMLGVRQAFDTPPVLEGDHNEKVKYRAVFPPGESTGAIVESGVFNAASGGIMLCRTTFPVVNKQADDTIAIEWTISITNPEQE